MNDIYKQLTNIDIEKQKILWDERGKGYYGEFLVFCELYKNISGNCKILMNLNIPTKNEKTTEIDLIMIHETGIYVFEIKHYNGTIYGKITDNIWTQYFRTVKNNVFKNPILQNEYHINSLKNILNDAPLKSIIVFTNSNCNIKINNQNSDINICKISDLNIILNKIFKNSQIKYSMEEIDLIFNKLSAYSPMQELTLYNGEEKSFISWLQPTIELLDKEKNNLIVQKNRNKKNSIIAVIINIIIVLIVIFETIFSMNKIKTNYNNKLMNIESKYNDELKKLKQSFKHVDEIDDKYVSDLNKYFPVSNVSLNETTNNSVTFTAKISQANDIYGIALSENSKYIIMTSKGKVYEYNVFGKHLNYNRYSNILGKGIRDSGTLAKIEFNNILKDEINYIKISNIELFYLNSPKTIIKKDLELELYSK